jgi:hypothetical protein
MKDKELSKGGSTNHAVACFYCLTSMYWDIQDRCWLCIICSYRKDPQVRSAVKIITEKVWNKIINDFGDVFSVLKK